MHRRTRAISVGLIAVLVTGLFAGCVPEPAPSASASASLAPTSTATPTQTPTPEPTETVAPAVLPTDCGALGTDSERQDAVGDMTLQSDGVGFVRPVPEGATLALGCDWIVGDSTGMLLLISTAAPADVAAAVTTLPGLGYTCGFSDDFGADYCQKDGSAPDTEEQIVARDGVWIYLSTANRNGRGLLSSIASQIWG